MPKSFSAENAQLITEKLAEVTDLLSRIKSLYTEILVLMKNGENESESSQPIITEMFGKAKHIFNTNIGLTSLWSSYATTRASKEEHYVD